MAEVERWVEVFAHRGNANWDSGIPVFRPHAIAVFSPGLRSEEHNSFILAHWKLTKGDMAQTHTHRHTQSVVYGHT